MRYPVYKTEINPDHKYALAMFTDGPLMVFQSFPSIGQLEQGYLDSYRFAELENLTKPVPVEILSGDNKSGNLEVVILRDMIKKK